MRWIAFSFTAGLAGLLVGCHNAKPQAEPIQSAETDYDSLQPDLYAVDDADAPYVAPEPVAADFAAAPQPAESISLTSTAERTHVVVKGDTLYGLARRYYNDPSRWKDIYESNRHVLSDPNRLRVGQELSLP